MDTRRLRTIVRIGRPEQRMCLFRAKNIAKRTLLTILSRVLLEDLLAGVEDTVSDIVVPFGRVFEAKWKIFGLVDVRSLYGLIVVGLIDVSLVVFSFAEVGQLDMRVVFCVMDVRIFNGLVVLSHVEAVTNSPIGEVDVGRTVVRRDDSLVVLIFIDVRMSDGWIAISFIDVRIPGGIVVFTWHHTFRTGDVIFIP